MRKYYQFISGLLLGILITISVQTLLINRSHSVFVAKEYYLMVNEKQMLRISIFTNEQRFPHEVLLEIL